MARNFNMSRVVRVDLDLINLGASTFTPPEPPPDNSPDVDGNLLIKSAEVDNPGGIDPITSITLSGLNLENGNYVIEACFYITGANSAEAKYIVNGVTDQTDYKATNNEISNDTPSNTRPIMYRINLNVLDGFVSLTDNNGYLSFGLGGNTNGFGYYAGSGATTSIEVDSGGAVIVSGYANLYQETLGEIEE